MKFRVGFNVVGALLLWRPQGRHFLLLAVFKKENCSVDYTVGDVVPSFEEWRWSNSLIRWLCRDIVDVPRCFHAAAVSARTHMREDETPEIILQLMGSFLTGGQTAVAIHGIEALLGLGIVVRRHGSQQMPLAPREVVQFWDDDGPEHFIETLKRDIGGANEVLNSEWLLWFVAGNSALEIAELLAGLFRKFEPASYLIPSKIKDILRG